MNEWKVQRFLSKEDWSSLLETKEVRVKRVNRLKSVRRVQFEEERKENESLEQQQREESEHQAYVTEKARQRDRYRALKSRLQALSQPKSSPTAQTKPKWTWADPLDHIGPANYDTRQEIGKPSPLSTRPNHPSPVIRRATSTRRITHNERQSRVQELEPVNEKPVSAAGKTVSTRSSTALRLKTSQKEERVKTSPKGSLGRSFSQSQGRYFDLLNKSLSIPDVGSYTPNLVSTQKGRYSVPKTRGRFNITRYSELSQRFNNLFLC